jgi:hypothetical protein
MLASQLASKSASDSGVQWSFHHVSCNDMADMVRQRTEDATASAGDMSTTRDFSDNFGTGNQSKVHGRSSCTKLVSCCVPACQC